MPYDQGVEVDCQTTRLTPLTHDGFAFSLLLDIWVMRMQDIQVVAVAASAAATGLATQAVAERDSVYFNFGSLAEDMLAVQDSLQAFSRAGNGSEDLPSPQEMPSEVPASEGRSSASPERRSMRLRPGTAPALSKELSSSCCSSISFTKGAATSFI